MAKLVWDKTGEHYFETGVDHGVLYVYDDAASKYGTGVVWNGLTAVTESPDGAEPNDLWADNIKYATLRSAETFGATIEAYTFPKEFYECDGTSVIANGVYLGQQKRKTFGFCYRTKVGSDADTTADNNYKLHIVYGCTASPSEKNYETVNDSPDAITLSWEITTTPVSLTGTYVNYKPVSTITINTADLEDGVENAKLKELLDMLYGTEAAGGSEATNATLPSPEAVLDIFA